MKFIINFYRFHLIAIMYYYIKDSDGLLRVKQPSLHLASIYLDRLYLDLLIETRGASSIILYSTQFTIKCFSIVVEPYLDI